MQKEHFVATNETQRSDFENKRHAKLYTSEFIGVMCRCFTGIVAAITKYTTDGFPDMVLIIIH